VLTWSPQIGNAESAHFTTDIGLQKSDLNTAVALFFAFFVALQPVGAALGRRYGMVAWVPTCMVLWGVCTALHAWVRHRWQLYTLRILIGCLEGKEATKGPLGAQDADEWHSWLLPCHRHLPLALLHALRIRSATVALLRPSSDRRRSRRHRKLPRLLSFP
jgi:MFS family permease